jgi:hypothetical protein
MSAYIAHATHAGATGVGGHHARYMGPEALHIGGGSITTWGGTKRGQRAPAWIEEAHARGTSLRSAGKPLGTAPSIRTVKKESAASISAHNAKITGASAMSAEVAAHNASKTGAK